ncbi:hypothetical protein DFJ58DRAFT_750609 [Suillus subalutaceus]|uniref:uncharacterized protein n=1 Tax=Suillus subalutaceus TaxID=48586 RepID=UPI001B85EFA1|nr:uncharacterized protein DFJ58DRAFT_750609 [Suillus subalutaceus]KAG1830063.1 hypothetical protein DFJ58DRAFT_750609 [Suillus subalutaceus]
MNLSLSENPEVLDLYNAEKKAATEWAFRSLEIQARREVVVQVFSLIQLQQFKRPRHHGPSTVILSREPCIPVSLHSLNAILSIFSLNIFVESLTGLLSPILVLNVLRDLFFFVSLLNLAITITIFVDESVHLRQYVVCTHVFDTRNRIAGAQTSFAFHLEYGREKAVNNTVKRDTTTHVLARTSQMVSDWVQFSTSGFGEMSTATPSLQCSLTPTRTVRSVPAIQVTHKLANVESTSNT